MLRVVGEITSWVRSLVIATTGIAALMALLGAIYLWSEPESQLPALLDGTSVAQKVYFLSREGFFIWRLTIDPDHSQLYLLDWVVRNFILSLGMLVLGLGLWAEGTGQQLAIRVYTAGGGLAGFILPYLYRVATAAKPWYHIPVDFFDPFYVSASALSALAGGCFGFVFFIMRRKAIRRRQRLAQLTP